ASTLGYRFAYQYTGAGRLIARTDTRTDIPANLGGIGFSYDTTGQALTYTIPAGAYSGYARDPEGIVTSVIANGISQTNYFNSRNEFLGDNIHFKGGQFHQHGNSSANGLLIDQTWSSSVWHWAGSTFSIKMGAPLCGSSDSSPG